jgi:hypothetical protein
LPDVTVTLADIEWQGLIALLAQAQGPGISWATVNQYLTKITPQLQPRMEAGNGSFDTQRGAAAPTEYERPTGGRASARAAYEDRT